VIPEDLGEAMKPESVDSPSSSKASEVKPQKVVRPMSKKDRKAAEKRLKEYQATIDNQLLSEKKQKEQAAIDEIKRAKAEAEAILKAKEAATARAKLAELKERYSGSGSKHLDSLHGDVQKKRDTLKIQKFDSAQKAPKKNTSDTLK
jgi:protein subunit release factor A